MIAPESLDIAALPSLPLSDRKQFPLTACIYFCLDEKGAVQYIGRTGNLNQRWSSHHRMSDLEKACCTKIAYLNVEDASLLREIETTLIEWFCPLLNGCQDTNEPMVRISATVPKLLVEQLRQVSKQERRSMSAQLTLLIEEWLELRNQKAVIAPITP